MKAYLSVFRIRFINGMQYRIAALAGVATQFFWGFMFIMIFEAFYQSAAKSQPISFEELVSYLWLRQAFLVFTVLWYRDNELLGMITKGSIAYELCRPIKLYGLWYAKLIAQRMSGALLRCFPILLIAFILPHPYNMTLPPSVPSLILFIITLLLGLMVLVAISMFIYISVFITMSPVGSLLVMSIAGDFFAGGYIPLPLMPQWLRSIAYVLPFRLAADLPFRVYSGNIPVNEAIGEIAIQIVWLAVLIGLGILAMNSVLKRVIVQGG